MTIVPFLPSALKGCKSKRPQSHPFLLTNWSETTFLSSYHHQGRLRGAEIYVQRRQDRHPERKEQNLLLVHTSATPPQHFLEEETFYTHVATLRHPHHSHNPRKQLYLVYFNNFTPFPPSPA